MNIVVVSWDYPDKQRSSFSFVKNLVIEWARQGHTCTVIAPYSITNNKRCSRYSTKENVGEHSVTVLRPNYFSFSNLKIRGVSLSSYLHKNAVRKALRLLKKKPDVIYCHFWNSAFESFDYALENDIPLFVATGESTFDDVESKVPNGLREYLSGVIAVSSNNRDISVKLGLTEFDKCIVLPNSIDSSLFFKKDRAVIREMLNIPQDAFIVAFVGWFDERKGVKRVEAALNELKEKNINSIFIGSGKLEPKVSGMLFKGKLPHEKVPEYLNAANIFVLPTLNEGCCNAVIEAMACGLPVISADRPFNWDVLNETNSILVDPMNVDAIKNAIDQLYANQEQRIKLEKGALNTVQNLTIDKRAFQIVSFMKKQIES